MKRIHTNKVILTLACVMGMVVQSYAVGSGGYGNPVPGARSMARASSVVASIDDASAVSFNPARLTSFEGSNTSLGVTVIDINTDYESSNALIASESAEMDTQYAPNFHIGSRFGTERWGFGLGINAPYGVATDWSETGSMRYVATSSDLLITDINPAVAYQVNEAFSVGAGLDYYMADVEMKSQLQSSVGAADGTQKLAGDGTDLGFNLGLAYDIKDRHLFGLSYRSGASIDVEGDLELTNLTGLHALVFGGSSFKSDVKSTIEVPTNVMLGYGFKPNENWVIEFDAEWNEWSAVSEERIKVESTGSDIVTKKDWKNAWSLGLGTEYNMKAWAFRGGIGYYDSPIPNETFEASIPDSDTSFITLGAGYTFAMGLMLDFAAQQYWLNDRKINNGVTLPGTYKTDATYLAFNVGYKWGTEE